MAEIGPELFPAGEALSPRPCPPDFGKREFVKRNLRIDPRARIAVPVPDAAGLGGSIDQQDIEPGLAQFVKQVDAAETGTDDHRVIVWRGLAAHAATLLPSAIFFAAA